MGADRETFVQWDWTKLETVYKLLDKAKQQQCHDERWTQKNENEVLH